LRAYISRKNKKREFRQLWITRIQAAARQYSIPYSSFINSCKENHIEINRKMMAELAVNEPFSFEVIVSQLQKQFICKKFFLSGTLLNLNNPLKSNSIMQSNSIVHSNIGPNSTISSLIRDFSHKQVGHLQTSIISNFNPFVMKWQNWRTAYENARQQYYINYYRNSLKDPLTNANETPIINDNQHLNNSNEIQKETRSNNSSNKVLSSDTESRLNISLPTFVWDSRKSTKRRLKDNELKISEGLKQSNIKSDNNNTEFNKQKSKQKIFKKFSQRVTIPS